MPNQLNSPSSPEQVNEVPLWINFGHIPYYKVKKSVERSGPPRSQVGKADNVLSVPCPANLSSTNRLNYTRDPTLIMKLLYGGDTPTTTELIRLHGISQLLGTPANPKKANMLVGADVMNHMRRSNDTNLYLRVDMMDTMFNGSGVKTYEFDIDILCKSPWDSISAATISNIFTSKCWPKLYPGQPHNGNAKLQHPDIWVIWISENPGDVNTGESSQFWYDGDGPQLSVLEAVATTRVGLEDNRILAIQQDPLVNEGFVPLQYKIELVFSELEPTIQDSNTIINKTVNRSTALKSTTGAEGYSSPS